MKALSHCQVDATISTGGAAYEVSVPPIDTLTNSTPSATYFSRLGHVAAEHRAARASARRSSWPPAR